MLCNKRIVIAGGSGFIGQGMTACWAAENDVTVLTRDKKGPDNSYGKKECEQPRKIYDMGCAILQH